MLTPLARGDDGLPGEPVPFPVPLAEAAAEAARLNPTAQETRLQWLVRRSQELGAWGAFEPSLAAGVGESAQDRENTATQRLSQLGRTEYSESRSDYNVGVEGKFFTGADYRLGYTLSRTASDLITGNEYESNLGLSVDQPLLKGATRQAPLLSLRMSRLDTLVAFHTYRKQLISVVSEVASAYWDLALARERLVLAGESVQRARDIAADARDRVAVGKLSEADQSEADLQVQVRLAEQEQATLAASVMSARMRLLLGAGSLGASPALATTDALDWDQAEAERIRTDARSRAADAPVFQPDVAIRRAELEKERIQLDYQRDQLLPQLTASGRLGYQGLGDSPDSSFAKLQSQDFPTWSLSLQLRIALFGDVRGSAAVEEARLRTELAATRLAAAERETSISVEALIQRVLSGLAQADNARAVSGFRRQLLEVERQRFDAGQSDILRIFEAEQNLSEARSQEMESCAQVRKARVDLAAASGTPLRDWGLEAMDNGRIILAASLD